MLLPRLCNSGLRGETKVDYGPPHDGTGMAFSEISEAVSIQKVIASIYAENSVYC